MSRGEGGGIATAFFYGRHSVNRQKRVTSNDKKSEAGRANDEPQSVEKKTRMPQHAIGKLYVALKAGRTPGEMEDEIYQRMFGCED